MSDTPALEAELKSAIPQIMARVRREAEQRIESECLASAMRVAVEESRKWAEEVLAPEIRAQLDAGKDGMLEQANRIAANLGEAVRNAMVSNAEKTLASSHAVKSIAEIIFRGY